MSENEEMFKNASPKLTFIFGIVLAVAIVSLIGLSALLVLSSQKTSLTSEVSAVIENKDSDNPQDVNSFTAAEKKDVAEMKFFVMTYCPFGQQAEKGIIPVARLMKDKAIIEPHYVIYSNYQGGGPKYCLDKESKYCSMHGINEVNEDVRQLCLWKYDQEKWWDYVETVNNTCQLTNIETCWKDAANKVGVDINQIETCFKNEAEDLLANELKLNKKYEVRGSPQVFINDTEYSGSRTPEAYKQALCSGFINPPEECNKTLSNEGGDANGGC